MSKKQDTEELTADDYKLILTTLAFYIGVDLSTDTPDDKMDDQIISLIEKVKKIGFKRKPKLTLLSYSKEGVKVNLRALEGILKSVDVIEEE